MTQLQQIIAKAQTEINNATQLQSLDDVRVLYLGKKGELTELLKGIGKLDPKQRPEAGAAINVAKQEIHAFIEARKETLSCPRRECEGRSRGRSWCCRFRS